MIEILNFFMAILNDRAEKYGDQASNKLVLGSYLTQAPHIIDLVV